MAESRADVETGYEEDEEEKPFEAEIPAVEMNLKNIMRGVLFVSKIVV